jgi:hypothetical protein
VANKFERIALEISSLTAEKNTAYGDSYTRACNILKELYPYGIQPNEYKDLLAVTRVIDKLFRIATRKDAFGESPWRDICGYSLLGIESDEKNSKDDNERASIEKEILTDSKSYRPNKPLANKPSRKALYPPSNNYFHETKLNVTPYPDDMVCTGSNCFADELELENNINSTESILPPKSYDLSQEYQNVIDNPIESSEIKDLTMRETKYEGLRVPPAVSFPGRAAARSPYASDQTSDYIKENYPHLDNKVPLPQPDATTQLPADESQQDYDEDGNLIVDWTSFFR